MTTAITEPVIENDQTLTEEELAFWRGELAKPTKTELAYMTMVTMNVDIGILMRDLASIYYVQLLNGWDIDTVMLAEYTEDMRGGKFIKNWLAYITSQKPYMSDDARTDLMREERTKKYAKWLR